MLLPALLTLDAHLVIAPRCEVLAFWQGSNRNVAPAGGAREYDHHAHDALRFFLRLALKTCFVFVSSTQDQAPNGLFDDASAGGGSITEWGVRRSRPYCSRWIASRSAAAFGQQRRRRDQTCELAGSDTLAAAPNLIPNSPGLAGFRQFAL